MTARSNQTSRIKILFITKWYPNRYDLQFGVFVRKHAAAAALNCDVALLYAHADDQLTDLNYEFVPSHESGFTSLVIYFRKYKSTVPLAGRIVNLIRYLKAMSKGLKYLRKNFGDHDITHAYILLRPAVVAYFMRLFRRKPFVISEQWSGFATGGFSKRKWFEKMFTRFVIREANAVTVVSEFLKDSMMKCGLPAQYTVIPNCIEPPSLQVSSRTDNKIKILTVSDLVDEIKNVSGTLRALAEIIATNSHVELHIIGGGRDRSKLESLASELKLLDRCVFFHGMKPNDEVYRDLVNCDFLVMNSNFETFSLICAEAISCGKPVVATRCGGPQEFVTGETGILIEPGNHDQLVHAMQQMIHGYKNYNPANLKRYVAERFSSEIIGKIFYNVYESVLSDSSHGQLRK